MATGGTGGVVPPPPDAGIDVPDAREDPPRVTCPASMNVLPRRLVSLHGMVRGPARFQASWQVLVSPPNSGVSRGPTTGTTFNFVADVAGTYSLRFEARDVLGASDACLVTVQARAVPPMVFCPRDTSVVTDRELVLTGTARDDDGGVRFRWTVVPAASLLPPDAATTRFRAARPGTYIVTFTATDIDGAEASCSTSVRVFAAPMAMCPPSGQKFVRMRPAAFTARADGTGGAAGRWALIKHPTGSQAQPQPPSGFFTEVTPDVLGEYLLEFVVRSPDGVDARCQTSFVAVGEAPALKCPEIETTPLTDTEVMVGVSDNGSIVRWDWILAGQPSGSAARVMFPMGDTFTFRPDLAGTYAFALTVTDDESLSTSCKFVVNAAAQEGLRVEMFWDTADTDIDLHLLSPTAKVWFDETTHQDCFYANCTDSRPRWGTAGEEDDPHLDLDDTDGFGPENVNLDKPAPGIYRVGVHAFSGLDTTRATVRIYCGDSRLEPRTTLGPVALAQDQLWKVADVEIFADGRCLVRRVANPDGSAAVVTRAEAESAR